MIKFLPVFISDYNCISPLGFDAEQNFGALLNNKTGIKKQYFSESFPEVCAAIIPEKLVEEKFSELSLNTENQHFTRLEQMLVLALKPLIEKHSVSEKSLLILSTTKGNVKCLQNQSIPPENAYLSFSAKKIANFLGFHNEPIVISNACVSGVMAVTAARIFLQNEIFSDAFVIAADEVSEFVLSGFNSFQAMSSDVCRPYDKNRDGINLGEASAAVFISKDKKSETCFEILGDSSINDANHISGPSRTGEGLFRSIQNAMNEAGISSDDIDFINAHGTATIYNDEMESIAFSRAHLSETPMNSLKAYFGHCLGASGLLEIIMAMESAKRNILIQSLNYENCGVSHPLNIITENSTKEIRTFLKTASGFGGSNSAIILKKMIGNENE